jgi:sodium-coupled monocarboxylate transporter 8/12
MKTASVLTGFIMYAKYSDCDPFTTKQVTRNDQLLPYYVMDVAKNIPGLSGLFIAGITCAALRYYALSNNTYKFQSLFLVLFRLL